jgi:hypothetical protein
MRRKVQLTILASLLILTTYTGFIGYQSVSALNNLKIAIGSGDTDTAISESANAANKFQSLNSVLKLPFIKPVMSLVGLDITGISDEISAVINASPYLAGVERSQRYLVAFQNTAEARGTGGILGAFAIVKIDRGAISIERTGSNAAMASLSEIPVPVTNEFMNLYGKNPAILQNSNLSPHLPFGAEIWMGLWKKQTGQDLDGVIAVDPSSLSYILRATGPITVNGREIKSENLVRETLKDAYKRFENDNSARKQYLVDIINATSKKLMSGEYSKLKMISAIDQGLQEGRILLYSRAENAEKYISKTQLGSFLGTDLNNEYRVVIQNIDASKLDYYLEKEINIITTSCQTPKKVTVNVAVTNTLNSGKGLPAYVLTRADKNKPADLVTGQHKFKVFIYGPVGSSIVSAWRENLKYGIGGQAKERMRPVMVMEVDLAPLESEKLQVNFAGGNGKVKFVDQPLVIPTKIDIKGGC